jgi:hypothetical protein
MPERILHPDFRNQNEQSNYPFEDVATLTSIGGGQFFADTFIDASIYAIGLQVNAYISQIVIDARTAIIHVGDADESSRATGTFDILTPEPTITLSDTYGRPAGLLLSDATRLALFQSWTAGRHLFATAATTFIASVVTPTPAIGIRGFLTDKGDLMTGAVWLVGEDGVVVRDDNGNVRIDLVGDPLFERALCTKEVPDGDPTDPFPEPTFLQTINDIEPDVFGDFKITAGDDLAVDTILRIFEDAGALKIEVVGQKVER